MSREKEGPDQGQMTDFQCRLLAHWLKYLPMYGDYLQGSIKRHFDNNPWDREVLRPHILKA